MATAGRRAWVLAWFGVGGAAGCYLPGTTEGDPCTEDQDCLEGRACDGDRLCREEDVVDPVRFPVNGAFGPNLLDPELSEVAVGRASVRVQLDPALELIVRLRGDAEPACVVDPSTASGWTIVATEPLIELVTAAGVGDADVGLDCAAGVIMVTTQGAVQGTHTVTIR